MKVKFKKDFIGRETAMQFANKDDILDIPTAQALALMKLGVVEEQIIDEVVEPVVQKAGKRKARGEHDTNTQ